MLNLGGKRRLAVTDLGFAKLCRSYPGWKLGITCSLLDSDPGLTYEHRQREANRPKNAQTRHGDLP